MFFHRRKRKSNKFHTTATMTAAAFGILSNPSIRRDASRVFVRAAFTSGSSISHRINFVPSRACGSASSILQTNNRLGNAFRSDGADHLERRFMSTTADEELDTALSEILGEAISENPASPGNNGHIEGSHPFPKELIEEVIAFVWWMFSSLVFRPDSPQQFSKKKKTSRIPSFCLHLTQFGQKAVCRRMS